MRRGEPSGSGLPVPIGERRAMTAPVIACETVWWSEFAGKIKVMASCDSGGGSAPPHVTVAEAVHLRM